MEGKKGATPPARSGHRLVAWKNFVVLYGGFQDLSMSTKYMNDLWVFDTVEYTWTNVGNLMPSHAQKPEARSGFSFLPHENGAVLFGGYSRVKGTTAVSKGGQQKGKKGGSGGGGGATRNVLKPMFHSDCWFLRMSTDLKAVRWERRKKPVNAPNPPRAGVSMAYHKGRGIMFGGVHDVEESEEAIDSQFFNDFFAWAIDRNRFFALQLRRPKQQGAGGKKQGGGRRDRAKDAEEELLENLRRLQAGGPTDEDLDELVPRKKEDEEVKVVKENSFQLPAPRFDAALAVQDDVLYIYGGRFEQGDKEDRELTFDEMFAIDLGKLDGVREVFSRGTTQDWEVEEEEEDGDEDDDEDDEDEEDEDEDGEPEIDEEEEERRRKAREERVSLSLSYIQNSEPNTSRNPKRRAPPKPHQSRPSLNLSQRKSPKTTLQSTSRPTPVPSKPCANSSPAPPTPGKNISLRSSRKKARPTISVSRSCVRRRLVWRKINGGRAERRLESWRMNRKAMVLERLLIWLRLELGEQEQGDREGRCWMGWRSLLCNGRIPFFTV